MAKKTSQSTDVLGASIAATLCASSSSSEKQISISAGSLSRPSGPSCPGIAESSEPITVEGGAMANWAKEFDRLRIGRRGFSIGRFTDLSEKRMLLYGRLKHL